MFMKMAFFHCSIILANDISINELEFINIANNNNLLIDSIYDIEKKINSSDSIYIKLQQNAEKNYFTRKLYGLFFRKQNIDAASLVHSKTNANEKFIAYTGKRIGSVEIIGLNAFGQSVYDSIAYQTSWIEGVGNKLHIKTANFLVKNSLLFKAGDILNPVDFAESEQILRSLGFIEDANIVVLKSVDTSMVEVKVITKDVWTIGVDYRYSSPSASQIQLYDKNLGGLGIYLSNDLYYDSRKSTLFGRKYELSITNIGGSFVDGTVWRRRGQGYESYAVNLKRDFYASKARYGGGASFIKSCEPYNFQILDSSQTVCFKDYDYWIGRSFRVSRRDISKAPHNFMLGFRYKSKYHIERPTVYVDSNSLFHNKEYYLVGLSLTKQELYRSSLIYSQGSTEDIPTGFRIQFTTGLEKGEFANRYYFGNELSAAELTPLGYLFSSARFGGFLASSRNVQQVTLNIRTLYFSNLFSLRNIQFRQFVRVDYTRGISRFYGEGESIFLDDNQGIRGLSSKEMNGTTRLVVNLETVAFSPLYIYGFRFAFFGYGDFGVIGSSQEYALGDQIFSGFGLGVRFRNENLILNAISIRLGYYPRLPSNANVAYWLITGQQRTRFENFRPREPQIIPFE